MIYAIAEEFIRIVKSIDLDLNLGFLTSASSNQSLFKVYYSSSHKINFDVNILVRTI
jgi:hypothetical protein